MSKQSRKSSKSSKKSAEVAKTGDAVETLKQVKEEMQAEVSTTGKKELTKEQRDEAVAKLLHNLYNNESLTSKDKKTIRRTLRDTFNYYISRERKNAGNQVVNRILQEQGAA